MADIFNSGDQPGTTQTETLPPDQVTVEVLVGEGRKYANPNELAKAYAHLEKHAQTLLAEKRQVEAERDARSSVDDLIKGFKAASAAPKSDPPEAAAGAKQTPEQPSSSLTPDEVLRIIQEREQVQVAAKNIELVTNGLNKVTGSLEASQKLLQTRASELGMSLVELKELAAKSPQAAITLLLPNTTNTGAGPLGGVRKVAVPTGKAPAGDYKETLRNDPRRFRDPEYQRRALAEGMAAIADKYS